jgi:hypothetical protein
MPTLGDTGANAKLFPNIAATLENVSDHQPSDFADPQSGEMREDQCEPISGSMFALRHYGKQALKFGVGEHSGLAHRNLMKGRDRLHFMMLPLSLPRDQRLQIPREPKDCGRLGQFRKPNKIHIL